MTRKFITQMGCFVLLLCNLIISQHGQVSSVTLVSYIAKQMGQVLNALHQNQQSKLKYCASNAKIYLHFIK